MSRDISIDQWEVVERYHPDIVGNYAELRLGAVISRRKTPESIAKRNQFNVVSLIKRRYGFGEDKLGLGGLAELLDISDSGVKNIVEAGIVCISADSEVFLPHHRGKAIFAEMERIRRVLEERRLLEDYLRSQSPLNRFQQKVIDHTMEGYSPQMITDVLNSEANLSHPTSENTIWHFLESVYKRVERCDPARLERKSLKATEVLSKVGSGDYENLKARASRDILILLEEGYQVPEIIEELALPKMHYRFLMKDVFMDLEGDPRGRLDLQDVINQVKGRRWTGSLGPKTINSIARRLLDPYTLYRENLAEDQLGDRSSWGKVLSARERELVEAVALGFTDMEMGELFSIPRGQAGIIADWLIGDVRFRPVSERNKEREELWEYFKEKAGKFPPNLYLSGMAPSSFLEHLVDGWTYQDIVQQYQQVEGRFTKTAVSLLYARIKAYRARKL